jgi:hypothetical protein
MPHICDIKDLNAVWIPEIQEGVIMIAIALVIISVCMTFLDHAPAAQYRETASTAEQAGVTAKPGSSIFQRHIDRSEGAFLVLVPKGWTTAGGMVRVNPITAVGGAGQAIEAASFKRLWMKSQKSMLRSMRADQKRWRRSTKDNI